MQDIKEYLSYDQVTGVFTWLKPTFRKGMLGNTAGTKSLFGYTLIGYKGKIYRAHRLAWWFIYNEMPNASVDHINGIKSDNRISNLRLATPKQNAHNINNPQQNNTSGYRGVYWNKKDKRWVALIKTNNKLKYLGGYITPEEAHNAYLCAKKELHPFWVDNNI